MSSDKVRFRHSGKLIELVSISNDDTTYKNISKNNTFYEATYLNFIHRFYNGLFGKYPIVVIDVGASIGNHSIFFSKILGAQVFAFEPYKPSYDILQENIRLNNVNNLVVARNFGIAANTKSLGIVKETKNMCGCTEWWYDSMSETKCYTLDHLFQHPVDFIKIDVQGMEMEVLKGAKELIDTYSPIIMIETTKLGGQIVNFEAFEKWMIKNNYEYLNQKVFKHNTHLIRRRKSK